MKVDLSTGARSEVLQQQCSGTATRSTDYRVFFRYNSLVDLFVLVDFKVSLIDCVKS